MLVAVALGVLHRVLQEEGHAPERPVGQLAGGLTPSPVEAGVHQRLQLRVEPLDAADGVLHHLGR